MCGRSSERRTVQSGRSFRGGPAGGGPHCGWCRCRRRRRRRTKVGATGLPAPGRSHGAGHCPSADLVNQPKRALYYEPLESSVEAADACFSGGSQVRATAMSASAVRAVVDQAWVGAEYRPLAWADRCGLRKSGWPTGAGRGAYVPMLCGCPLRGSKDIYEVRGDLPMTASSQVLIGASRTGDSTVWRRSEARHGPVRPQPITDEFGVPGGHPQAGTREHGRRITGGFERRHRRGPLAAAYGSPAMGSTRFARYGARLRSARQLGSKPTLGTRFSSPGGGRIPIGLGVDNCGAFGNGPGTDCSPDASQPLGRRRGDPSTDLGDIPTSRTSRHGPERKPLSGTADFGVFPAGLGAHALTSGPARSSNARYSRARIPGATMIGSTGRRIRSKRAPDAPVIHR